MQLKIIVAAHKPYFMPADPVYVPVQAGAALSTPLPGYTGDDSGENISSRNRNYCELTALYWAWKNLDAEYCGVVHYRRHFAGKFSFSKKKRIISGEKAAAILEKVPVIMPRRRHYFIESNFSQYVHAHNEQDLAAAREVIAGKYPDFLAAFDTVMKRSSGYRFNMFIMRRDLFESYCSWLFDILFEVEKKLDISGYSAYDARVFGFIGERLLDVWIEKKRPPLKRLPVVNLESQHWGRKAGNFLLRKISGGRWGRVR